MNSALSSSPSPERSAASSGAEPVRRPLRYEDVADKHVTFLIEVARRQLRHELGKTAVAMGITEDPRGRPTYRGLRPSHMRLLSLIPAGGTRVSDLTGIAGMTKQGLGQFMDELERLGFVESLRDPNDRRVRLVRRTKDGDEVVDTVRELYARTQARLRRQLGAAQWDGFLHVLTELAGRLELVPD